MKRIMEAKQEYDNIPIPEELSERVMLEIEKAEIKNKKKNARVRRNSFMKTFMKRGVAAAAAIAVLFAVGLNTSEAFAKEISNIPVIGAIAKVFTFRSYETETEDLKISVDIPSIEMISEELKGLEKKVNKEIYEFCKQYADEAIERAKEYKQAFLETGGTEEEWEKHNITIKVWYEVKAQTDKYLSLAVMGSESWSGAYSEARYYNFDLEEGKWVTLEDILGDNYAQVAEQSIREQVEKREKETGMEYWLDDWEGIGENTKFYMNQAQNPVIIFEKYEIAPGAAGQPEFEIQR